MNKANINIFNRNGSNPKFRIFILLLPLIFLSCEKDKTPLSLETNHYPSHDYEWVVDTLHAPDALQVLMYDIWGTNEKNVYVVGHSDDARYQLWHWDGDGWQNIRLLFPGHPHSYSAIFGFSENDIWIVGDDIQNYPNIKHEDFIIHYDGIEWKHFQNLDAPQCLSVWGSDPSNVFVGCDSGVVLYYEGNQWTRQNTGIFSRILSIQGFSLSNVFAAGWTIDKSPHDTTFYYFFEYEDSEWRLTDSYMNYPFAPPGLFGHRLWASPEGKLYGAGDDGLYSWKDGYWARVRNEQLFAVYGTGINNIFAGGWANQLLHFNGNDWKLYKELSDASKSIYGIWCTSKEVFAISVVGNSSLVYRGQLKMQRR